MAKGRALAILAGLFALAASGAAIAQTAVGPFPIAPGVERERRLYQRLHIEERYGLAFHPYASLCNDPAPGVVNCLADIVTDDSGTPLTFDPAKQTLPGYSPQQLQAAYGVSGMANGTPIIGIVDAYADPSALDDLKVYSKQFNLPILPKCKVDVASSTVPCLQIVNGKGKNNLPDTVVGEWAMEQSLDLDMAHATCENCSILLVEANTNAFTDIVPSENTAAKLGASVISNSWGDPEWAGEMQVDSQYFTHPGVVMTAGAGDKGYGAGLIWPAASPNVISVGATSLFLSKNGKKYNSEAAWADTGSGCSAYEARPSWQSQLSGCPNNRTDNDISVDGDPNTGAAIYNSNGCTGDNNCWYEEGGTSMSAPIVAALFALAGNVPSNDTQPAALLYQNASKTDSRDVSTGANGTCSFAYLCTALKGYDGPTGLGSPKGLNIFIYKDSPAAHREPDAPASN